MPCQVGPAVSRRPRFTFPTPPRVWVRHAAPPRPPPNILNNGKCVGVCIRLPQRDRLCIPVPLYHCFGMVMGSLACITHGSTAVFPGEAFEPGATLAAVAEERCTALHGVPTMFIAVSYTHLRAHETVLDLVCRLLLEKKNNKRQFKRLRIDANTKKATMFDGDAYDDSRQVHLI